MESPASWLISCFGPASIVAFAQPSPAEAQRLQKSGSCNKFYGSVKAEFLKDGRNMRLLERFTYLDPYCRSWEAPAGAVVDGASIPMFAWSIIGGPFEGKYREASVIHDVGVSRTKRALGIRSFSLFLRNVGRGVDRAHAKVMYAAVYHFGPRWDLLEYRPVEGPKPKVHPGERAAFLPL